jgi:hypothetical protein
VLRHESVKDGIIKDGKPWSFTTPVIICLTSFKGTGLPERFSMGKTATIRDFSLRRKFRLCSGSSGRATRKQEQGSNENDHGLI